MSKKKTINQGLYIAVALILVGIITGIAIGKLIWG